MKLTRTIKTILATIISVIGAILGFYAARKKGLPGRIEREERNWQRVPGSDSQIAVRREDGKFDLVELPEDTKPSDVRAVALSPEGEGPDVTIEHYVVDRRRAARDGDPNHDLSL